MTTLSRTLRTAAACHGGTGRSGSRNAGRHGPDGAFPVPFFAKASGVRHESIPAGATTAIRQPGQRNNFVVEATEQEFGPAG